MARPDSGGNRGNRGGGGQGRGAPGRPARGGARSGGREFGAEGGGRRARPDGDHGGRDPGARQRGPRGDRARPGDRAAPGGKSDRPFPHDDRDADRPLRNAPRAKLKGAIWRPGPDARVIKSEAGMKLSAFLVRLHPELSMRAARRLLEVGSCRIDGRIETFHSRLLKHGETVEVILPTRDHEHHFDPRRVLYDQDGVFVYDKPAWLPVTPTDGPKSWSLHDILKLALKTDNAGLIPVHRLDADTSGVVIMAREPRLARKLEEQFRDHLVAKAYLAIVRGHPREQGLYRSYLVKVAARRGFEQWRSGRGPDAREAITAWTVEARLGSYASRVRVEPQTGRHHQIRLHFAEMGHPIYGDRVYGDRQDPIHAGRHLLHAAEAAFTHPATGEKVEITAPEPAEFAEAERQLLKL
jgi:RluA family pseudouridine synthase